jgi:phosphopantothenoylcysteine decarboxylase/phosphopantothenate--cysteine ligase
VRFISNRSSGKMGFALARAAARRGAEVTLITTVAPPAPLPGVTLHFVETAEEMGRALMDGLETADVILMAAAVADYRAVRPADGKPPKAAERLNLELTANPDLVAGLSRVRREHRPFLVAFAAEAGDPLPSAREKLRRKGADLIVANDISAGDSGMGSDFNQVSILAPSGHRWDVPRAAKDIVAEAILDAVAEARAEIAPRSRSARRKPAPR